MRRGFQRFIPIIFLLLVVALIIAAIISIARLFFNSSQPAAPVNDSSSSALVDTSGSHAVRMTVRGQIVGDEIFRSYQVTVRPTGRDFVRYKGYNDDPLQKKHYSNSTEAYEQFVYALDRAGLAQGQQLTGEADDTRGLCAGGVLYEFEILDGDSVIKHLWTSTCKGVQGSLRANADQLRELFLAQVPDAVQYIGKN